AISLDPQFVQAHCEYGIYFMMMVVLGLVAPSEGWFMVRSQAQKALDLDPSLAEGHAMLGAVAGSLEYDWKEAERHFRLAIAHDPVPLNVRLYYSLHLMKIGRPTEAVQQADLGLQEDPLSLLLRINRATYLAAAGRIDDAFQGYREILELNPNMVLAQFNLAGGHASRGEWDRALVLCEAAYANAPLPRVIGLLAGLLTRAGDTPRAAEMLGTLQPAEAFGVPLGLALYHWVLKDFEAAADWFEAAIEQRDPISSMLVRAWYGAELRSTPRWGGLMRRLKLPESE
ncbi:MAG TPA: tetratricopeptide repeat protein, partial [Vicinamibacterales bacterium]